MWLHVKSANNCEKLTKFTKKIYRRKKEDATDCIKLNSYRSNPYSMRNLENKKETNRNLSPFIFSILHPIDQIIFDFFFVLFTDRQAVQGAMQLPHSVR